MRAYSVVRRSDFFDDAENLDIAHAESGLIVMTGTGLVLGSLYGFGLWLSSKPIFHGSYLFLMGIGGLIVWALSYFPANEQQRAESLVIKSPAKAKRLRDTLESAGYNLTRQFHSEMDQASGDE